MATIHLIEECIHCGALFKPLHSENKKTQEKFRDFINKPLPKNSYWEIITHIILCHEEADVLYFLCPACCKFILKQILSQMMTRHREILFRKFERK